MTAVFVGPLLYVFYTSLVGDHGFTLSYYGEILSRQFYLNVFVNTIDISVSATICTLFAAYPIAYHLSKRSARQRALLAILVLLPFWTSILVKSFAFMVFLGHAGVVNNALANLGFERIPMLFNRVGVMIGLVHFLIPFMVFAILPNLLAQPKELRIVADIMGAGPVRIFFRITLPLSTPGIVAGSFLCFSLSLGSFIIPALLGGRRDMMIGNLIDFHIHESLNWNVACALAVALSLIAALVALMLGRFQEDTFGQRERRS